MKHCSFQDLHFRAQDASAVRDACGDVFPLRVVDREGSTDGPGLQSPAAHVIAMRLWTREGPDLGARKSSIALSRTIVETLTQYVDERLDSRISVGELAQISGFSQSHFSRLFKAATRRSPYHFVLERRISRAKSLLQSSETPIVAIALACGFSDQEHFTHTFRRHTQTTPRRFRQQMQGT